MSERITIIIETGNAAFDDYSYAIEVGRILRTIASQFESCREPTDPRDINDNLCGSVKVEPMEAALDEVLRPNCPACGKVEPMEGG